MSHKGIYAELTSQIRDHRKPLEELVNENVIAELQEPNGDVYFKVWPKRIAKELTKTIEKGKYTFGIKLKKVYKVAFGLKESVS